MYEVYVRPTEVEPAGILRVSDGAIIPIDTGNRDYQEYLVWLEGEN